MTNPQRLHALLTEARQRSEKGQWADAQRLCHEVLATNPRQGTALHLAGLVTHRLGDSAAAAKLLERAVHAQPNDADFWNNFGNVLQFCGRVQDAMQAFREATRLKPSLVEARSNLGFTFYQQGQLDEAIKHFQQAIAIGPDFILAYNNLACALLDLKRYEEAIAVLERAIQRSPTTADTYANLGDALRRVDRHDEALAVLEKGLTLSPRMPEALINLGGVHKDRGEFAAALAAYEKALAAKPDYANAHWNRALILLAQGDFEDGWEEFEWRLQVKSVAPDFLPSRSPRWTGGPLAGQTILLIAEQGLGDTLQFVRYGPLLKQYGARVTLAAQRPLLGLLSSCAGIDQLVTLGSADPPHDVHLPLMSLPRFFSPTIDSLPHMVPYLYASENLKRQWGEKLGALAGFKIGIAWQGNPAYFHDRYRSVPLRYFEKIAHVPGVQLISLQKVHGLDQWSAARKRFSIVDLGNEVDTAAGPFMDTAAVLSNLDLVISSDTAVVHLAGALGVPVWMPTSFVPDWRWFLDRTDSPWYPRMRLFRQRARGDWEGVFEEMARALAFLKINAV